MTSRSVVGDERKCPGELYESAGEAGSSRHSGLGMVVPSFRKACYQAAQGGFTERIPLFFHLFLAWSR